MSLTFLILIVTGITTYLGLNNYSIQNKLIFNPYLVYQKKQVYRLLTHGFIHADLGHVLFNLLAFWMFGTMVEERFTIYFGDKGPIYFLMLYLGGIVSASLYSLEKYKEIPSYNALGASGAVSAVVFASILLEPTQKIGVFIIPPIIPGYIFGFLYLWYSNYMAKKGHDNVGHDAHFWGAVFGFAITLAHRPQFLPEFIQQITESFQ